MLGPGGTTIPQVVKPPLYARFEPSGDITRYEIEYAYRHFAGIAQPRRDGTQSLTGGADPATHGVEIIDHEGRLRGVTMPFDLRSSFSLFDSASIADEEDRAFAVETLRSCGDAGLAYVEVVEQRIAPPWPSYDQIGEKGGNPEMLAKRVVKLARDFGIPLAVVASYERANLNRDSVLDALAQAFAEDEQAVVDEAALEVTIT